MDELQKAINMLQNHETFATFIKTIHQLREETISELHQADTGNIQQLSGRIISYDQILQIANWDKLRKRHQKVS